MPCLAGSRSVAIHAAKKRVELIPLLKHAVETYLEHYGLTLETMPYGAIVGAVDFRDSYQMGARVPGDPKATWDVHELVKRRCPAYIHVAGEHALGDFRIDRWAWEVTAPEILKTPIPYSGSQGVFHLDLPTSTEVWRQLAERAVQPATREITRPILNEGTKTS